MRISKIKIENIRGIESKEFELNIPSNNPIIIVAPNGFGKTSIATAFSSLKAQKIDVAEENLYKNDVSKEPKLTIRDENGCSYYADKTANTISDEFSVFTIKGQVKSKATNVSFGGFSRAKSSLVIDPIVLYKTVPSKKEYTYSFTNIKSRFGNSVAKLLINYSELLKNQNFVLLINECKRDILSLHNVRSEKRFQKLIEEINSVSGTKNTLVNNNYSSISEVEKILQVEVLISKLDLYFTELSLVEKLINLFQLSIICKSNEARINDISKYYTYLSDKQEINEMLELLNCTWKTIKASQKNGSFIIEFPKADQISNGERDVLCFVGHLFEAKKQLRKNRCILVIDEIFDYLDDANLIAAQYFLTKFIKTFKASGREIYPILLTHLDPMYFNTYSFSIKNVVYLSKVPTQSNKYKINNMLKDRNNCKKTDQEAYDIISSNYLHYSEDTTDAQTYLSTLGIETPLKTPVSFRESALLELDNYRNDRQYDIALACCGLRILIEKKACEQLSEEHKQEFITQYHKTVDKLSFAKNCGADIPETYFLLSIIYNECMHLDDQCKRLRQIYCKLNNKVIRNMICSI